MKRPSIKRLPNNQPQYTVMQHTPERRGGISTCTVYDRLGHRTVQGPFTSMTDCAIWCDRLSRGEDLSPQFEAIWQSAEVGQLRMEALG